jgi:predicted transcriptional regulator/DNA-binding XRE family transcriptional regulator
MNGVQVADFNDSCLDALTIGKRIRQLRLERSMTIDTLARALKRAPSQVSVIENGKRELKISELRRVANALGTTLSELLNPAPPSKRAALEIALERAQQGPLFSVMQLRPLPIRKTLSDSAIETILALHEELLRIHRERAATPEVARRANTELRAEQRRRNNYFAELEEAASELLRAVDHAGGPLSQRVASELAAHLGFSIHYVVKLPASTRSVTDRKNGRIYLPMRQSGTDAKSSLLQALAAHVLDKREPKDYSDFLRQRVETNYFAGALLIPGESAYSFLSVAKNARELSIEDLRDEYAVSYETAAHRFTNLATELLGIPVHFLKVHSSGAISKAYENDDVVFPADALGSVEGQIICRWWSARHVFEIEDRFSPYHQYTDKPGGTYWCTSSIQSTPAGDYSVSVGTGFGPAKWFRGRDTKMRHRSTCPDEACCRRPSDALIERWEEHAWPSARLNSSLLAAMPIGTFTGIDQVAVYEFLESHSPDF